MEVDMTDPYSNFVPPPSCPVYTPSEEDFQDPLAFIAKIRPEASKTGICKIKPPSDWQPPFVAPVDCFKFVPRIQRLNELEAGSRIKINFLDRLYKFWELQGTTFKVPHVCGKLLDMQGLYSFVEEEGGMEHCTKERKWSKIANRLGLTSGKAQGSAIKAHYERLLHPFSLFKKGQTVLNADVWSMCMCYGIGYMAAEKQQLAAIQSPDDKDDKDYKPYPSFKMEKQRKSKRLDKEDPSIDYSANNELRKLQFFGAGPKAAVPPNPKEEEGEAQGLHQAEDEEKHLTKTRIKKVSPGVYSSEMLTQVDKYHCGVCTRGDGEEFMLLCDGCDDAFHTYCLIPPLPDIPKGDWRCPSCVKQACSKPLEMYGFAQSKNEYTLRSFGEMADHFKSTYFNRPVHLVTPAMVEKEFWRLVSSLEEDVCVLYGADIHAKDVGSGFPTKDTANMLPEDEEYINSGWNLNNLPVLKQSVLCHINGDISGMKIPWCYVGMCFSSFCWHIEDHWSYSINYLHWGEPKTWYGVPGSAADQFEEVMRQTAPELFENAPDLLHQLTTIMNPNILTKKGVPIFRTDQHAGEFVITFPRAYHAGFNNGYNFAEAVNFCPSDWLPMGRLCVEHYRSVHRECVFSHEELICKMAADPDSLDLSLAAATHGDMVDIVETEKKLRKKLLDKGTVEAEREAFELLPDDERQCHVCKTTCFLSSLTCSCSPDRVVCLHHAEMLCSCPPSRHCLRYRYTLDELPPMLSRLKTRAEAFDKWNMSVNKALEATGEDKAELWELQELLSEAEEKKFPDFELRSTLAHAVTEAEKCANVANQLVSKKVRTRNRQSLEGKHVGKLTLDELNCFYDQVITLPCRIHEAVLIKELVDKVVAFQKEAKEALTAATPDSRQVEKLIDIGITLDVDLPEIPSLKQVLQQARWLDEMYSTLKEPSSVTLDVMRRLIESGVTLAPHPALESAMAHLQELLTVAERWEEKARVCLQAKPRHMKNTLEAIIQEAKSIPANLPNVCALRDAVRKANDWVTKVDAIQTAESYPYLDVLEGLVNKGRPIPVRLDQLPQLESQVAAAKSWRERTARTFLKKNSSYTLLEVLSPRGDIGVYSNGRAKKKKSKDNSQALKDGDSGSVLEIKTEGETRDPAAIVETFKKMESREVEMMRDLRVRNTEKASGTEGENRFCVCRKGAFGFMLQCELCKDWFHGTCVPLPKSATTKPKPGQPPMLQASHDFKFLCPVCLRSRRPRLETILSLLVSLQKLPVRLAEGEALQCLTERAMGWQDRARQMLVMPELASALATLTVLSQRRQEQAAREKTEKIISAELRKAASNPELQGHLASVTQSAFGRLQGLTNSSLKSSGGGEASPCQEDPLAAGLGMVEKTEPPSQAEGGDSVTEDIGAEVDIPVVVPSLGTSSEHAYSSVSKQAANGSPRKHARKTPLVPRQADAPVMEMSEAMRVTLEELMMEGDLLEVTLDETQHIWKLLQACHLHADSRFLDFKDTENMGCGPVKEARGGEKKTVKVRRVKDKEGLKAKAKLKALKEKKRKKVAAGAAGGGGGAQVEGMSASGSTVDGSPTTGGGGDGEGCSPPKRMKVEPGATATTGGGGGGVKPPVKKKMKRKDGANKVQLKVNKEGFNTSSSAKGGGGKVEGVGEVKKKKKKVKVKQEAAAAVVEKEGGEKKKAKVKRVKVKKEKVARDVDSDDDDNDDEDCAASKCLRPIGNAVNWVQCDSCELWFHLLCVGLGTNEICEEEDYVCTKCSSRPTTTNPSSAPSPAHLEIKQEPQDDGFSSTTQPSAPSAGAEVSVESRESTAASHVSAKVTGKDRETEDGTLSGAGQQEKGPASGGKDEGDVGVVREEDMEVDHEGKEGEVEGGQDSKSDAVTGSSTSASAPP
ncbi:lysine-specific demethylase 5A-like [Babylonia areolata]|uniref:lysine-specific demethylase 5A-like n=1 Tax=Babylonia areolata TaxID=304850 RepID=UPI003FD0B88B